MRATANQRRELVVIADIVVRAIQVGRKHEKHGVRAVLVVDPPYHRRNMYSDRRAVERHFVSHVSIVQGDGAGAPQANQELVQGLVGVLTPYLAARHVEHNEVALDLKREVLVDLAEGKRALDVL